MHKQIIEFSSIQAENTDLDAAFIHIHMLLQSIMDLPLAQRGLILLLNPRQQLVAVSRYGLNNSDNKPPLAKVLDSINPKIRPYAYTSTLSAEMGPSWKNSEDSHLLLLPLHEDDRQIGIILLCLEKEWKPSPDQLEFLTDISLLISGVVTRILAAEALRMREHELEDARTDAIRRLGIASEYRDNETGMHIMRMTHYAAAIAKEMGVDEDERERLIIAAPMHDVGKIGISDAILHKPGKLTDDEFESMKAHTSIGAELLSGDDELLRSARQIALNHHENWDGSGYPFGLRGEDIPLFGRICSVADVFDALVSQRPYKKSWELDDAIAFIKQESGKKFDPTVVKAFTIALPNILRIKALYSDDIIDPNKTLNLPERARRDDEWVEWDDYLSVGIDTIDEHHQHLIDLINDLYNAVNNKQGARSIARIFSALSQYTRVHFRAEEQLMDHYGFSNMNAHKHQHGSFERKLVELYKEFQQTPLTAQHDALTYLRDWLIRHIAVEDAQLRELTGIPATTT